MKKRKILYPIIIMGLLISLVGCGKTESTNTENKEGTISKTENVLEDINLEGAELVAYQFVTNIQKGDFKSALELIDVEDKTFLTPEDIEYFIPYGEFEGFVGTNEKLISHSFKNDEKRPIVYLTFENHELDVFMKLIDNEWKINYNAFYITQYKLDVPEGAVLKLRDVEVSKNYLTTTENGRDIYTIPYAPNREIEITIQKDGAEYTTTKTPLYGTDVIDF